MVGTPVDVDERKGSRGGAGRRCVSGQRMQGGEAPANQSRQCVSSTALACLVTMAPSPSSGTAFRRASQRLLRSGVLGVMGIPGSEGCPLSIVPEQTTIGG